MQKIRPIVALSGDDRLLESMEEFRIYGRVDHTLDTTMTTFSKSTNKRTKIGNQIVQRYLHGFTSYTKCTKGQETLQLLFMENKYFRKSIFSRTVHELVV